MTFFDLLTRVLLLQPSMSLGFTTVWGHCFVFKLFYTVKPQSCFLFSHLVSVAGRRSMAWLLLLSSVMFLLDKELLWWCILPCSIFTSMSSSTLFPHPPEKILLLFLMKSCASILNFNVVILIKFCLAYASTSYADV